LKWFGFRFPKRRFGFIALGLGVPAVLHGFYDNFLGFAPLLTLASAVVSAKAR
jgi:hypothetical protein